MTRKTANMFHGCLVRKNMFMKIAYTCFVIGTIFLYNRPISHDVTCAGRAICDAYFQEDIFFNVISHKKKMRPHALTDIFKTLTFLRL